MTGPGWWDEFGAAAEGLGHDRHSAAWYRSVADQYVARFPGADVRSVDAVRRVAEWAERREATP